MLNKKKIINCITFLIRSCAVMIHILSSLILNVYTFNMYRTIALNAESVVYEFTQKLPSRFHKNHGAPCSVWSVNSSRKRLCETVSVSAQDGNVALGKAHARSAPPLSSFPKVALETVPMFVWLNTDHSRPRRVECRPLPFSTPLSFRRSMLWPVRVQKVPQAPEHLSPAKLQTRCDIC